MSDGTDLAAMRESYSMAGLAEADLAPDWLIQFRGWLGDAVAAGIAEPNAMVVATASPSGEVASRTVLCKGVDEAGIVFYTNLTSDKSRDLEANPRAAATFPWIALQRQVHFRGPVERVSDETAQSYWATRPRGSRLGAWASPQSTVLPGRDALNALRDKAYEKFGGSDEDGPIPLPPFWGGWRIQPEAVEFWQGRIGRLHDRLRYRADRPVGQPGRGWAVERLAP
ncbi:MAG: pyridoxamine 5'-phosphate oxidase [Nakamurella sp.]